MALLLPIILVPFVVIVLVLRARYGLAWWGTVWRGLFTHVVSGVCGLAVAEVVLRFAAEMGRSVSDTILVDLVLVVNLVVYLFVAWWLVYRSPLGRSGRAPRAGVRGGWEW
jgi:hypothetical protein